MTFFRRTAAAVALAATVVAVAPAIVSATTTHGGAPIVITTEKGEQGLCTLNSVAQNENNEYFGITAGHCLDEASLGSAPVRISTKDDKTLADAAGIKAGGHVMDGDTSVFNLEPELNDFGWFKLADGVTPETTISSKPNTGIVQIDDLLAAPALETGEPMPVTNELVGKFLCKDGAMTGRTCGVVFAVNEESQEIAAMIPAIAGDSGSPMYVIGDDGKAHVVGTLSSGTPVLFNLFDGTRSHMGRLNLQPL